MIFILIYLAIGLLFAIITFKILQKLINTLNLTPEEEFKCYFLMIGLNLLAWPYFIMMAIWNLIFK